jgi:limonene 1,2-monooxygenase
MRLRFGAFLAPVHNLSGNPTLQIRRDLQLAEHLDELGFDEIWYGEHHSGGAEIIAAPELMIAAAAERTKRIRLGTGVVTIPYHNPFMVADRIVQLDHQTHGRMIFGVGAGALAYDAHMIGVDHNAIRGRVEEGLDIITRLFKGETVTAKSDWYNLNDARMQVLPYSESIEMAVAAVSTTSGPTTAGRFGAGLLSIAATTSKGFDALPATWDVYAKQAAAFNNPAHRSTWRLVAPMHIAETREQARRDVRHGLQEWLSYFTKVGTLPLAVTGDGDIESEIDYLIEHGIAVIGTPDDLIQQIQRMQKQSGGFGCFLNMAHNWAEYAATKRSYELVADYVMPVFKGQLQAKADAQNWARSKRQEFGELRRVAAERVTSLQNTPA